LHLKVVGERDKALARIDEVRDEERSVSEARIQALEKDNLYLSAPSKPILVPVETTSIEENPIVRNERNTADRVFPFMVKNHGAGPAIDGVFQVARRDLSVNRPPLLMVQFVETRIDVVPADETIQPKLTGDLEWFSFIGASSTGFADELTLEYQSTDNRWYQTIVSRHFGRWSEFKHIPILGPSSRKIDQAHKEARSSLLGF